MKRKLIIPAIAATMLVQSTVMPAKTIYANSTMGMDFGLPVSNVEVENSNNFGLPDENVQIEEENAEQVQVIEEENAEQAIEEEIVVAKERIEVIIDEKSYIQGIHANAKESLDMVGIVNYYKWIEFSNYNDEKNLVKQYRLVVDGADKGLMIEDAHHSEATPFSVNSNRAIVLSAFTGTAGESVKYASKIELYAVTDNGEYLVFSQDKTVEEGLAEEQRYLAEEKSYIESIHVNPEERYDYNGFAFNGNNYYSSIEYYNIKDDRNLVKRYKMLLNGQIHHPTTSKIGNYTLIHFSSKFEYETTNVELYAVTDNGEYLIFTSEKITNDISAEERIDVEFMHKNVKEVSTMRNGAGSYYKIEFNNFEDSKNLVKRYKLVVDGANKGSFSPQHVSLTANNTRQIFIDKFFMGKINVVSHESNVKLYAVTDNGEYLVFENK